MNPLDRLLYFFALREGRRADGFNLAADPARSLLPHRLSAGLLAAAFLLTTLGMAGRWQLMKNQNPPSSAQLARLKQELQDATADAEQLRVSFNPEEAKQLGNQVREANFLIALRALRPSEQLADLEAVKPFSARFSGLQRKLDRAGTVEFDFRLIAAERSGFEALRDRIARSHRFTELQLRSEILTPNGYEATLTVDWAPVGAPEKTELPPAMVQASAPGLQPALKTGATSPAAIHPASRTPVQRPAPATVPPPAARPQRSSPSVAPAPPVRAAKPPDQQPPERRPAVMPEPRSKPMDPRPFPPPPPPGDGGDQ